jgi:hypothetical protein
MKKSSANLSVIQNFILHLTHSNEGEGNQNKVNLTPDELYAAAIEYIEEDHVDGKGNSNDTIVKYSAESSFVFEDKERKFPETVVVIADKGELLGTETVARFSGDLKEVQSLLKIL